MRVCCFLLTSVCYYRFNWWLCCCVVVVYSVWKRKKTPSFLFVGWLVYTSPGNSTHSNLYNNVVLEVDCGFMDWSWRSLLSDILNDLWTDIHKAFFIHWKNPKKTKRMKNKSAQMKSIENDSHQMSMLLTLIQHSNKSAHGNSSEHYNGCAASNMILGVKNLSLIFFVNQFFLQNSIAIHCRNHQQQMPKVLLYVIKKTIRKYLYRLNALHHRRKSI